MRKKISYCILCFLLYSSFSHAQSAPDSGFKNIGISFNLLGPLFGEYNIGVSTFLTPNVQVGGDLTYFDTQYISPDITGWQTQARANYYFSTFYRSGFYLGSALGFESVSVRKNNDTNWERYDDITWSVVPGYSWVISQSFSMMLGLNFGYNLGDNQVSPEINFLVLF